MGSKVVKSAPQVRGDQRTSEGALIIRASRQALRLIEHMDKSIAVTRVNMENKIKGYEARKKKAQDELKSLQTECHHPRLMREKGAWICASCTRPADVTLKK